MLDVVAIWTGDMFNVNTSEMNAAICGSEGAVSAHWLHGSEDSRAISLTSSRREADINK